jgi:E1A-binding protein p400
MYSDDSLPSLHLAKAGLVKELLWLKNNDLVDYDENSKQLLQEVRTVLNLKWKTPYPQSNFVTNGSTPRSARNKSASGPLPFTNHELLSMKQSYSHQPNPVELIDDVAEQARKDSYIIKRVSELEQSGLMRSRVIPKTGRKIAEDGHSTALLNEMVEVAAIFAERKREKVERLASLADAAHDYHYYLGVEGSRAQKEGQTNTQKTAKLITRHVMDFWNQVDELIRLKHTESIRMKEKENMGKHLDHLVDQTEKFSTALAIDIQVKGAVNPFEPTFDPEKKPAPLPSWRTDEQNHTSSLIALSNDSTDHDEDDEDDGFFPGNENSMGWEGSEISEDFSEVDEGEERSLEEGQIKTKIPFLLKFQLREYQHLGLDWLATMYDKKLNGILADEMGLGKTIMTISLLAHVAVEKGAWGPHLIIVPTSVLLNWDMELRKWCPAFKIISYYGTPKERKLKRQGWTEPNTFHICITSYQLAIQDQNAFKRRPWHYIILDEAHHIKNSKSQRWQTLLQFKSKRRLLLTGTPIQNNLMELWSLMHFLMPNIFESSSEFKAWFDNPVNSMIEGESEMNFDLIQRLHGILRPFILRRLKSEVEQQLPKKYEHVIFCDLSKRQRGLYEEFIANNNTQCTLKSGSFLGIANVLMQLRKVCNHPDLFEARPILSSFDTIPLVFDTASHFVKILDDTKLDLELDLVSLNLVTKQELTFMQAKRQRELKLSREKIIEIGDRIFKEEMEERPEENPVCNPFFNCF